MKRIIAAIAAAAALAGCGTVFTPAGEVPVSSKLSPAAQAAQSAIHESNILLNAVAQVVGQNAADGITLKAEAQKQLDLVRAYGAEVDRAQKLLDAGDIVNAKNRAELTHKLIVALHREVAQKARKTP